MFKQFKLIDKTSSYKSGSSIAGVGVNSKNLSPEEYKSLIFNSGSSQYLNRTPSVEGNRKIWTWSGWVKRGTLGGNNVFMGNTDASGYNGLYFQFDTSDNITIGDYGVGSYVWRLTTSQVFRDPSSWYHIVATFNSTQATASDRVSVYINGTKITAFSTATYPSLNLDGRINSTQLTSIGRLGSYNGFYFDGYLTEINFIDGQALSSENFGYFDTIGIWQPRKYSGSYGINGFYLPLNNPNFFELAKDKSGNSNHWTLNGYSSSLASNVVVSDSPVSNYATANFLDQSGCTFTNGLLNVAISGNGFAVSSIGVSSGKWYAEVIVTSASLEMIGICQIDGTVASRQYSGANGWYYYSSNGQKYNNGTGTSYGATYTTNDIIGIALDMDSGSVTFYKNGTTQGVAYNSGISGKTIGFALGRGSTAGSNTVTLNFGQRPFAYTAPTGFKALCTTNLPTPTIKKSSSYMDVVTYTGNGSTQTISGLGFSPDLVWGKSRSAATNNNFYDALRGTGKILVSNDTDAEVNAGSLGLTAFNSNGFSLGSGSTLNNSGSTYVAWAWDESPIAGMDIVSYTGTGAIRTVAHNLGVAPKMIIAKLTNSAGFQWPVYHSSLTSASSYIWLNSTNAQATDASYWGTAPTSSVFSVGTNANVNNNTSPYIAYCFAEVEGFSKFGSYTGNGSTDGPFVYCGFRPRFIMIKITNAVETWIIKDTARSIYNGYDVELYPTLANVEGGPYSPPIMDYLSNGFKLRSNTSGSNASAGTYIFLAFAESPFKYSRAR